MSELHNPIFDEEKEFLERKKLEYERALRGDVEHIKQQSATVGKVALVGAGLAGTVWLIRKAFGGKKHRSEGRAEGKSRSKEKNPPKDKRKSAAASAMVFMDHFEDNDHEFGGGIAQPKSTPQSGLIAAQTGALSSPASSPTEKAPTPKPTAPAPAPKAAEKPVQPKPAPAKTISADEDPFQDLPYDDSRRLPSSTSFDKETKAADGQNAKLSKGMPTPAMTEAPRHSVARVVGSVLQQFLQSDTGKVLVAQVAALALAAVTKKAGEFFPADKNADLAGYSDMTKAPSAASPVASPAPSASPDASKSPQPV